MRLSLYANDIQMQKIIDIRLYKHRKNFAKAEARIDRERKFYAMLALQKEADDRKDRLRLVK